MDERNLSNQRGFDLEKRVADLEETIGKMLPGRRSVLQGAGAMGLVGLGFSSGSSASTLSDDPALGSSDNRVDVYADEVDALSISTDALESVADHIITTKAELQALPSNLGDGETVWVGRVEHDQPIEIDGVDDVTITGSGVGSSRITTEAGTNSGLFHIGHNSAVGSIRIQNLTIDGNADNNDGNVDLANPIWAEDVDHLTVENVSFVDTINTSGTGDRGDNTSTIRAFYPARRVDVRNCEFHGNVTRHVEASCEEVHVTDSFFENCHERNISLDSLVKNNRFCQRAYVKDNLLTVGSQGGDIGAHVGAEGLNSTTVGTTPVTPTGDPIEEHVINDNVMRGGKRTGITVRDASQGTFVYQGNTISSTTEHGIVNFRINSDQSVIDDGSITVTGGQINDSGSAAIRLGNRSKIHVQGVVCDGNRINVNPADHITIEGCDVHNSTQNPSILAEDAAGSCRIRSCAAINPSGTAMRVNSTGSEISNCDVIGVDDSNDAIRVDADEARISDCYIGGDSTNLPRHGVFCIEVDDVVVIGNVAKNISGEVVRLHKSTGEGVNNYTQPVASGT